MQLLGARDSSEVCVSHSSLALGHFKRKAFWWPWWRELGHLVSCQFLANSSSSVSFSSPFPCAQVCGRISTPFKGRGKYVLVAWPVARVALFSLSLKGRPAETGS